MRRALLTNWGDESSPKRLFAAWGGITLIIPTLMQTKVAWYLNPFYPLFAMGVGVLLARGFAGATGVPVRPESALDAIRPERRPPARAWRLTLMWGTLIVGLITAEAKLLWYSYRVRDISQSGQALLLAEGDRLAGQRVYFLGYNRAGKFVAAALLGAEPRRTHDLASFHRESRPGDYVLLREPCPADLKTVRASPTRSLCRRS